MGLSDKQRVFFFKLARRAYDNQQPLMEFNAWRKSEMVEAGLPDSVKKVSQVIGYDTLMLHFAELAYDMELVEKFQTNESRMLQHVIGGLVKDLDFITRRVSCGCKRFEYTDDISRAPIKSLRTIMQGLGQAVIELCNKHGIEIRELPTAAKPYEMRGKRAADFNNYILSKTGMQKRKEAKTTANQ